ncbi:DUF3781 domain-containing protein [Lactiplantibacillus plajomi]|uniref:DUF3781 domain-containing protein n=1 Tax=Lactiplantibacillus plajomi TaxID=1457217 RepID=A0ABV6K1K9_9LACO|nr:DUF3781 domain-containing protein [Lactiplantibacillus plajomi]
MENTASQDQVLATLQAQVGYTPLVFARVNKKLGLNRDEAGVKALVSGVLARADEINRHGKNYYVLSHQDQVELTINASNYRLITASKVKK